MFLMVQQTKNIDWNNNTKRICWNISWMIIWSRLIVRKTTRVLVLKLITLINEVTQFLLYYCILLLTFHTLVLIKLIKKILKLIFLIT